MVFTKNPFKTMFKGSTDKIKDGMHRPEGAGNFDNMDDYNIVQSVSLRQGTIQHTPTNPKDIVNKSYADSAGVTDHGALTGLADDDHTQYVKKAGDTMTGDLLMSNANIKIADGTSTNPSIRFLNDADNGFYLSGTNKFSVSIAGAEAFRFNSDGAFQNAHTAGSATAPEYSFISDADTGIFIGGSNILGFSAGGVEQFRINTAGLLILN